MGATYHGDLEVNLSAKLIQTGNFKLVDGAVDPHFFVLPTFGIIWSAMEYLNDTKIVVSAKTVETELDRKGQLESLLVQVREDDKTHRGVDVLEYLNSKDVSEYDSEAMVAQLQAAMAARKIIALSSNMKRGVLDGTPIDEILAKTDLELGKVSSLTGTRSQSIRDSRAIAHDIFSVYEKGTHGKHEYIETGLMAWDGYTEGLYPGRVYIIAGSSGSGKSTFAQNLAYHISIHRNMTDSLGVIQTENIMGGIISLEMDGTEVGGRFLRMIGGIRYSDVEKGRVKNVDLFDASLETLQSASLLYDSSTSLTLSQLRAKLRKMATSGAKYVIVDQLGQLSTGLDESMGYAQKDYITYRLKSYAREMHISIIVCHQLNKSVDSVSRKDIFNTNLSDLQESGQNAVDGVCFVRRNREKCGIVWAKVRQEHDMPSNISYMSFDVARSLFKDSEYIPEEMERND